MSGEAEATAFTARAGYRITRIENTSSRDTPAGSACAGESAITTTVSASRSSDPSKSKQVAPRVAVKRNTNAGETDKQRRHRNATSAENSGHRQGGHDNADSGSSRGHEVHEGRGGIGDGESRNRMKQRSGRGKNRRAPDGTGGWKEGEHATSPRASSVDDDGGGHVTANAGRVQGASRGQHRQRGSQLGNHATSGSGKGRPQQQAWPAKQVSSRGSSSVYDVTGANRQSRNRVKGASPDQQQSAGSTTGRNVPAGRQLQQELLRSAEVENIHHIHVERSKMKADAEVSIATGSGRRSVRSRLGSPPRSPRHSLFRDESTSNNSRSMHNRAGGYKDENTINNTTAAGNKNGQYRTDGDTRSTESRRQQQLAGVDSSTVGHVTSPRGRGGTFLRQSINVAAAGVAGQGGKASTGFARTSTDRKNVGSSTTQTAASPLPVSRGCSSVAPQDVAHPHAVASVKAGGTASIPHAPLHARGTCTTMCPKSERLEREREAALSIFEATEETAKLHFRRRKADPRKTVKKYRRSAAGRDMQSPKQLRPLSVLQTTAEYLVRDVFAKACSEGDKSSSVCTSGQSNCKGDKSHGEEGPRIARAYIFVEDRLRAVRQDLTVQGLGTMAESARVLQIAANFYIVAGYLMTDQPTDVFDKHLHTRELQGVFASLADVFFQSRVHDPCPVPVEDEYLCLQAVHALATAVANNTPGQVSLTQAAGGKGVGRVFSATLAKLYVIPQQGSQPLPAFSSRDGPSTRSAPSDHAVDGLGPTLVGVVEHITFGTAFPKVALAVQILAAMRAGNWSELFRLLGRPTTANFTGERGGVLVGDYDVPSPFAIRLRCVSHGMLLPLRAHALRALNKAFSKGERVPLLHHVCSESLYRVEVDDRVSVVHVRFILHASRRAGAGRGEARAITPCALAAAIASIDGGDANGTKAYVKSTLQMRTNDHAAGLCRALSLPVQNNDSVVLKSVPAEWKNDRARQTGFMPVQNELLENDKSLATTSSSQHEMYSREDAWVGLEPAWLEVGTSGDVGGRAAVKSRGGTCEACGGFGCEWCEGGEVESCSKVQGSHERLWDATLAPK